MLMMRLRSNILMWINVRKKTMWMMDLSNIVAKIIFMLNV